MICWIFRSCSSSLFHSDLANSYFSIGSDCDKSRENEGDNEIRFKTTRRKTNSSVAMIKRSGKKHNTIIRLALAIVRIGNFERRSTADVFADSARGVGFRSAWVVPSKIEIPIHPDDK